MKSIKSVSGPELALAAAMERIGLRPDLRNDRGLPGRPDFAFKFARLAVFVDGAFWHGRSGTPRTNAAWWAEKLARNRARDRRADAELKAAGWLPWRLNAKFVSEAPDAAATCAAVMVAKRERKIMEEQAKAAPGRRVAIFYFSAADPAPPGFDTPVIAIDINKVGEVIGHLRVDVVTAPNACEALDTALSFDDPRTTGLLNTIDLDPDPEQVVEIDEDGQPSRPVQGPIREAK